MSENKTNSTPLWRELRDKITSGEAGGNTYSQYTALAVNNLHKLAEALENMLGCFDNPIMRRRMNDIKAEAIHSAKVALETIS